MLGAAHALANPLTTYCGVAHGQAVGVMLPHVVRFNGAVHGRWYRDMLEATAEIDGLPAPADGPEALADFLTTLASTAGLETRLTHLNVPSDKLPQLAADAVKQWTGIFNPRPVDEASLLDIYRAAF
jgi:alcohol dehydrogenase